MGIKAFFLKVLIELIYQGCFFQNTAYLFWLPSQTERVSASEPLVNASEVVEVTGRDSRSH